MKRTDRKAMIKKLDRLWSKAILERDKHICQYCRRPGNNPHHIYSRSKFNTRFDLENGITLCSYHHTLSSTFSAHKAPRNFWIWLEQKKGKAWLDQLEQRSEMSAKGTDLTLIEIYLKQKKGA